MSTFDITFIQIQVLRYYSARSRWKTVSVHISALISPSPGWERENYTETSGAFVIFVWVIKRQRKRRWIFHPIEMHMAVAGRTSFFHYSHLRRPNPSRMLLSHPQVTHEHRTFTAMFWGCASTAVAMLQHQILCLCGSVLILVCVWIETWISSCVFR